MIKTLIFYFALLSIQCVHAATLPELYKEAEGAWAQGNLVESQLQFEQIENTYPLKSDWSNEERRLFRLSFLRLAQLSEKREVREQRLIKAYSISSEVGDEDHMFPKELILDLHTMKGKLPVGFNQSESSSLPTKLNSSPFATKKTWLIVGITALVVGVTYSLLNQRSSPETESKVVPGSAEGFK